MQQADQKKRTARGSNPTTFGKKTIIHRYARGVVRKATAQTIVLLEKAGAQSVPDSVTVKRNAEAGHIRHRPLERAIKTLRPTPGHT